LINANQLLHQIYIIEKVFTMLLCVLSFSGRAMTFVFLPVRVKFNKPLLILINYC